MAILFSNEILNSIKTELNNATFSVQIITAYCKESSFRVLDSCISDTVSEKRLLVRFRLDDIVKGSTDFGIVEYAQTTGWKVYVRFDLHAKTYIVDNKRCLVGSANATNLGLSIRENGNMEMASLVDVEPNDIEKIDSLFADAILVDDVLLEKMKNQLNDVEVSNKIGTYNWDSSITSLFSPKITTLFSYEFPESSEIKVNDYLSFLDVTYDGDKAKIKEAFRWSNPYLWLLKILEDNEGCLYFGALSERLHNALVSDPKPCRKDVKVILANLLSLIDELEMEEIKLDRPNHSQRVRLVG